MDENCEDDKQPPLQKCPRNYEKAKTPGVYTLEDTTHYHLYICENFARRLYQGLYNPDDEKDKRVKDGEVDW